MRCIAVTSPYINQYGTKRLKTSFGNSTQVDNINYERLYWGDIYSDKINGTSIGNFRRVDNHFYRGAQPGIDEFNGGKIDYARLKNEISLLRDKFNISIIMNLRNQNDNNTNHIELEKRAIQELNDEAKIINNSSLKKIPEIIGINIPMYAEAAIPVKSEDVEKIMNYFNKFSDKNFYIHCRSGNDRTGVVTALYRVWKGDSLRSGIQEMRECGHNSSWYPGLINSVEKCLEYMKNTETFKYLKNMNGKQEFLKFIA